MHDGCQMLSLFSKTKGLENTHTHNSAGQEIGTPGLGLSPPVADGLRPPGTQGHEGLALMTQACQHFRSSTGHSVSLEKQQLLF